MSFGKYVASLLACRGARDTSLSAAGVRGGSSLSLRRTAELEPSKKPQFVATLTWHVAGTPLVRRHV